MLPILPSYFKIVEDHRLQRINKILQPNHISKMVLSTVKSGPPNWTKSRTFTITFTLAM